MTRPRVGDFRSIPDETPDVARRLRAVLDGWSAGEMRAADYTDAFGRALDAEKDRIQSAFALMGKVVSFELAHRQSRGPERHLRYLLKTEHATLLQKFVLDAQGRIASAGLEDIEWEP